MSHPDPSASGECCEVIPMLPGLIPHAGQQTATITRVRQMARDTWAVCLHAQQLAQRIIPGQFLMIRPSQGTDPLLGRPFALYNTLCHDGQPADELEFGFVTVGKLTHLMSQWTPGDLVRIWGPLGNGFPVPDCRHLICVAGGIGQTPFLAVIREALGLQSYGQPARTLPRTPQSVTLCYGVRSAAFLAGLDDFEIPGLQMRIATDDGSHGHHGYVTELLQQQLQKQPDGTHVYCCGPEAMMKAVARLCGVSGTPCWLSLETPMACGFGACFSCVTRVREPDGSWDYRRTCVEGPVFSADRLML